MSSASTESTGSTVEDDFMTPGEESSNVIRLSQPNCRESPCYLTSGFGFSSNDRIAQGHCNFKKSSAPLRFLLSENNAWVDFPKQVFDELTAGFAAGKAVFEVSVGGNYYLFDFIRMFRIERSTKALSAIAWIDVNGQCFFPPIDIQQVKMKNAKRNGGLQMLGKEEKFYKIVEKLFLNGMKEFDPNVIVTSVAKCLRSGFSRSSRSKTVQNTMIMTKEARGDANVRFGWYGGASAEAVDAIVDHGFEKSNSKVLGLKAHGHGLHLSSPHFPYASSLLSPESDSGEKHMVLCRIIMGNSERVEAGSLQSHPSDEVFDSGVDDLVNPRWYIVWRSHMNTHISPEYVVSFRSSNQPQSQPQGLRRVVSLARKPTGLERFSFQKLFSEMGKSLPSSSMQNLMMIFNQHKEGKLTKDTFIRRLRSIVGDKLLASSIRRMQGH